MRRLFVLTFVAIAVMVSTAGGYADPDPVPIAVSLPDTFRDAHVKPSLFRPRPVTVVVDDGARQALDALEPLIIAHQREVHGICGEWYDEAISVGWTPEEWKKLRWIIARETGSTCDPTVHNGNEATRDDSFGLLQINMRGKLEADRLARCGIVFKEELWDPIVNLRCGRVLFELAGWDPWRMR